MVSARSSSRLRRSLWVAGSVLAVFTLVGFFIAPPLIKAQLEKRLSAELGRVVTIGKVRVNPYALSVTIEQLDVQLKEGRGSFFGWNRLQVNFDALGSLAGVWTLDGIALDGFHAAAIIKPDGNLNFADVLARFSDRSPATTPAAPATKSRPLRIRSLVVTGARLEFADQSRPQPFATTIGPLSFAVTGFQTADGPDAPYHFDAVTESNEKLRWAGTLQAEPFSSTGELHVENVSLAKYAPYYAHRLGADITDGRLSLTGRYAVSLGKAAPMIKLLDGSLQVRGLKMLERATGETALELPELAISGVHADALKPSATVDAVRLTGGQARMRREKNGAINWVTMFLPPTPAASANVVSSAPSTPAASSAPPLPEVKIGELALQDWRFEWLDLAAARPAKLAVAGLQVSLKDFTLAEGATMPVHLALDWAPQGQVRVDGTVALKPEIKADLKTEIAGLALLPLSPYLEDFINARLTKGTLSVTGTAGMVLAGETPAVIFDGGVTLEQFGLVDGAHQEELAGFTTLALRGLKVATAPQLSVALAEVALASPYARVIMNADKTLNLALVAKPNNATASRTELQKAAEAEREAGDASANAPEIAVQRVVIDAGDFSFVDRSLEPNVRLAVTQFGGAITGLSSRNLGRGEVDLKAAVDGVGPITIAGKLDPLGAQHFADLRVDFKNVDLLPLSPYSGKFAGYEIARGKLGLDVKAKLEGQRLDASNVITLNQFNFGAPVASPEATKLPVRLGVALLKDTSGRIVIDVPVSGNLDDPSFRVGKVVVRVIVNLLTKAAVSPFSLLGSMFGGGGEELAFQEFVPGRSEMLPTERAKLETMVKALQNRPALSLALEGSYGAAADAAELKRQKVDSLVRNRIWEQRRAGDPTIAPPDRLEIPAEEHAAMVRQWFYEKFPAGSAPATTAAPAAAPVAAAPTPVEPKRTFLKRTWDLLTLKGLRNGDFKEAAPVAAAAPEKTNHAAPDQADGPALEAMVARLAETMEVTENDLRALATTRVQRVRDYFLNEGKIAPDRLFLAQGNAAVKENKGPRVFLSLQ